LPEIAIVAAVAAAGAAIAALVGRDDVEAGIGERRHHLAPGIGELGETVEEEDAGPVFIREACFEDMHAKAVDA